MTRARNAQSIVAEAAFRSLLDQLGATLIESEWLGATKKHRVLCRAGHASSPTPADARRHGGICITCAGKDPRVAEIAFRARLTELGCTPLFGKYISGKTGHHVRCAEGHDCYPRPDGVIRGRGVCRVCAGLDPDTSEVAFRARLAELGALLIGDYRNARTKVHVRCPSGHDCYPTPHDVQKGRGICLACAGKDWDVFYVVTGNRVVKFGVTSGDPHARLSAHAAKGYTEVVRLAPGLPGTTAPDAERAVKQALALAGERPVRGKEYFDISCLALVLDVADSWLSAVPVSAETASRTGIVTAWRQEALFAA